MPDLLPPEVTAAYGWDGWPCHATPCGDGHLHLTVAARLTPPSRALLPVPLTDGALTVIFQRLHPELSFRHDRLMDNIERVTARLREDLPPDDRLRGALFVFHTVSGQAYVLDRQHHVWRCYWQVPHAITPPKGSTDETLIEEIGRGYGRFLRSLCTFPADSLYVPLPYFHHTPRRLDALRHAADDDPLGRAADVGDELAFCLSRADDCARLEQARQKGRLPVRVTHNDAKPDNLLLDAVTHRCVCVLDLDTVMPGLAAHDFGDLVRAVCAQHGAYDPTLYAACLRGYLAATDGMLTPDERRSLPWGARLMALECGIRFLTDYLQGDTYFAVTYPAQNLDRCRRQLRLVATLEPHFDDMLAMALA